MSKSLGSLLVSLQGDNKHLLKTLNESENRLYKSGKKLKALGSQLTASITLPFVAAAAAGAKFFLETEKNFLKIETLVGITGDTLDGFKSSVAALSVPLGQTKAELADALFVVTSAGARGADALKILEQAGKASAVGLGATAEVARATTAIIQAYGKENMSAARATDILYGTVRAGNLEAESLAPNLGKVIGLAARMGISFEEVGASVATYTRLGVSAEDATTSLSAIMTSILNPTDKTRGALESLGMSADSLRQSVREKGLAATLTDLVKSVEGNDDALGALIPNVRALRGVLGTAGVQAEAYGEILNDVSNSTGLVNEGFAKVSQGAGAQFKSTMIQLRNVAEELGAKVMPILLKAATAISNVVSAFTRLNPETQNSIIKWTMLAAAVGPALMLLGNVKLIMASMVKTAIIPLAKALNGLLTGFKGISKATAVFRIGVSALAIGAVLVAKNWDKVKSILVKVVNYFIDLYNESKLFAGVVNSIAFAFKGVKIVFEKLIERAKLFFSTIGNAAKAMLSGEFGKIPDIIKEGFKDSVKIAKEGADEMAEAFAESFEPRKYKPINETDIDKFFEPVTNGIDKVKSLYDGIFNQGGAGGSTGQILDTPEETQRAKRDIVLIPKIDTAPIKDLEIEPIRPKVIPEMATAKTAFDLFVTDIKSSFEETFSQAISTAFNFNIPHISETRENLQSLNEELKQNQAVLRDTTASEADRNAAADRIKVLDKEIQAEKERGNVVMQTAKATLSAARDSIKAALAKALANVLANALSSVPFPFNIALAGAAVGAANGLFDKVVPALATGGLAYGPTLAMVGDNPGAGSDPEVIAPLSKLQDYIGGGGGFGGRVELYASGDALLGVLEAAQSSKQRTRGF